MCWASASAAQESTVPCTESKTDWSLCVAESPKECWAVSKPKDSIARRDGRTVAVRRGEILLWVFYRPQEDVKGQVSFTGGYPFANGSTVQVEIGTSRFELFTEGEYAWPASPEDDAKIVSAMKRGAEATLVATSSRGTETTDRFSLLGFTAMVEDAEKRCTG